MALSTPLFVQCFLLCDLVERILRVIEIHDAFARSRELGAFLWVLDAKNEKRTRFEECWKILVGLQLQSRFIAEPHISVKEGDYTDFEASYLCETSEWPVGLPEPEPLKGSERGGIIDLRKILTESLQFKDSKTSVGLQLADIATNAFRRAITGRLQIQGWNKLGELMLTLEGDRPPFDLVRFSSSEDQEMSAPPEYRLAMMTIWRNAKSALAPMSQRKKI